MASKMNKHFREEDWTDFVNGQVMQEKSLTMQRHLDEGCAKCSKSVALWRSVGQAASREADFEPPASALRHIRNSFAIASAPKQAKRTLQIPRLVFDSFWQPAMVGVRSAINSSRQVLYLAGEVAIEMRLEPEPNSEQVNIAGQITESIAQGDGIAGATILISSAEETLSEASTNKFGEFQLSFVPEESLRISFSIAKGKEISIPLDGMGVRVFYR
jgi:hypothetical protein